MNPDNAPSLLRSFERHLRAENRSDNTIESYLKSIRQAEAFLPRCGARPGSGSGSGRQHRRPAQHRKTGWVNTTG